MNAAIPESFRTRFERDGVVFPIPVLSPEKFSRYLACFSEIEDLLGRSIKRMGNPALYFSWAYRLATEPPVLDAVEEILGPDERDGRLGKYYTTADEPFDQISVRDRSRQIGTFGEIG